MSMTIGMSPIGIIHTPFTSKKECPIQGSYAPEAKGTVEVYTEHELGLKDVELFSHLYLFYHFHDAGEIRYVRPTFLDDAEHGIYASRHPCRPNGIGMSIVGLASRKGRFLEVTGIDVLDRTPLLDIKPYIPRHDRIEEANEGWIAGLKHRDKPAGRE